MEAVKEQTFFKIDGEFVCDLARSWFWDENRPFDKCEELLLSCLVTDQITLEQKKEIVVEILEGKKKLVGVNTLDLVDDGQNVRPLADKIEQYRRKDMIQRIRDDMERRPLAYVDRFSCPKAPETFRQVDNLRYEDRIEVEDVFGKHRSPEIEVRLWAYSYENLVYNMSRLEPGFWNKEDRPYLDNGLFLLDRPETVFDIIGGPVDTSNEDGLISGLYAYLAKLAESNNLSEEAKKEIRLRNNKYRAAIRSEVHRPKPEPAQEAPEKEFRDHWEADGELNAKTEPDDIVSEYGLIDRQGNYYSCSFSGHHVKAFSIICEDFDKYLPEKDFRLNYDNALDILYNAGWAIIRNPDPRGSVFFDYRDDRRPTKRQIDRAFDHMIKFGEHTLRGIEKYLED